MQDLKYGLLNEKLVHISEVVSGLECNCVCPHCGSRLIARKGNEKTHHFAHYKLADCNHGTETALHIMAKNIIAQTKQIFVPLVHKDIYGNSGGGKVVAFEKAELEKQLSDTVRSDVLLSNGDRFLNVEIKVTHEIDLNKKIELFNLGIPTIEIDFSDIKSNFTTQLIEKRLLDGLYTELIFSPKRKDIFAKLLLGEWKKIHRNSYVNDCPLTHSKAYFVDYQGKGGSSQCHECNGFYESNRYSGWLLCRGVLDDLDYSKIDKILHLEKEEKHIRHVKLLMSDGSIFEKIIKK